MTNTNLEDLRIYQGAQTEMAVCGDYSKGTYRAVAQRNYGQPWGVSAELEAALASAPRLARCG